MIIALAGGPGVLLGVLLIFAATWRPLAIVEQTQVVGFVMWAVDTDASRWIGGLVIDAGSQRRGVGRATVRALIEMFRAQDGATGVGLSYDLGNAVAQRLYAGFGFVQTGEMDDDQLVARLHF